MRQKITKPKQAASARQLDRWQREVQGCIDAVSAADESPRSLHPETLPGIIERLVDLLQSMRRAERR